MQRLLTDAFVRAAKSPASGRAEISDLRSAGLVARIREALAVPGRAGIRVIAKQFGVSPMTVQNVAR